MEQRAFDASGVHGDEPVFSGLGVDVFLQGRTQPVGVVDQVVEGRVWSHEAVQDMGEDMQEFAGIPLLDGKQIAGRVNMAFRQLLYQGSGKGAILCNGLADACLEGGAAAVDDLLVDDPDGMIADQLSVLHEQSDLLSCLPVVRGMNQKEVAVLFGGVGHGGRGALGTAVLKIAVWELFSINCE